MRTYLTHRQGLGLGQQLEKQIQEECDYWEHILRRVTAVIRTLAERCSAFRGTEERFGSLKNGNCLGFFEPIVFLPKMADHRIPGELVVDDMVLGPNVMPETIQKVKSFELKEEDVLIASYVKTGTTWVQELVWLICNNGNIKEARSMPIFERIPFIEFTMNSSSKSGLDMLQVRPRPYLIKTHLRSDIYQSQIEAGKVKIIVGIRNPKDTLVSLYHFYRMNSNLGNFKGTWDDFFELYKTKHLIFGDYFKWYSYWLQYKDKPNVKLVKYEDLHHRMSDVIDDVCQFLGKTLSRDVIPDIIQHLTFDDMSQNSMVNYTLISMFDNDISPFMRKGKIGDWKNYFSEEQSSVVDKRYREVIEPLGVTLEFE
ncbi:hypothetical protein LSH36_5g16027 [Paralvinella palmiformis]|uniref:Sulfotransferase domain-containing protein n=1 Tax=Paralvinella palmiformis TaxID=53620 RepID=A0AAD9KF26_9ANNE|nr:hypothetical protein LSH36_5g16027 [Paralvinella palmiformis]